MAGLLCLRATHQARLKGRRVGQRRELVESFFIILYGFVCQSMALFETKASIYKGFFKTYTLSVRSLKQADGP